MLGTILHWVLNSKQPAKIPKSMTTHHPTPDRPLAVGSSTDTTEDPSTIAAGDTSTIAAEDPSTIAPQDPSTIAAEDPSTIAAEDPGTTRFSQGYFRKPLPHIDVPGLIQHITFHLADSLPRSAIERMEQELASLPEAKREIAHRQRIQELLDSGLGSCVLGEPVCAEIVQNSLLFGDGDRYHLFAWVVMPNHVHVLIEQIPGWPMWKVVQSWKRHTSRQIHRLGLPSLVPGSSSCTRPAQPAQPAQPARPTRPTQPTRPARPTRPDTDCNSVIPTNADYKSARPALWQRDYWDRFIRNDRHFLIAKRYIEENPVVAGLATSPEAWSWGSAHFEPSLPDF